MLLLDISADALKVISDSTITKIVTETVNALKEPATDWAKYYKNPAWVTIFIGLSGIIGTGLYKFFSGVLGVRSRFKKMERSIQTVLYIFEQKYGKLIIITESPRKLSDYGEELLLKSKLDTILSENYDLILYAVKAKKPDNAYHAEIDTIAVVNDFILDNERFLKDVENVSFQEGVKLKELLLLGGLHIRDRILESLDMNQGDIDKHKPKED